MILSVQFLHRPPPKTLLPIESATSYGDVAQLVERLLCKQEVVGSIPIVSTNLHLLAVDD